jgi:hypothetical protein
MPSTDLWSRYNECLHHQDDLASIYLTMKEVVIRSGYSWEIDWQEERHLSRLTEREFLAEGAWVILSSGMRESVVARHFPRVSKAFKDWASAQVVAMNRRECEQQALQAFNNPSKIEAIASLCERVNSRGFERILEEVYIGGVSYLMTFNHIGPVTSFHLAKNIGLDVVKPDRHLTRMAAAAGYSSPEELCQNIAKITGEKISVIDIVLWRYATLDHQYGFLFKIL